MLAAGLGLGSIGTLWFQVMMLFSGTLAGVSGSSTRSGPARRTRSATRTTSLGLAAGAICAVLYIATQIAANPALLGTGPAPTSEPPRPLLLFAVVIRCIVGFTFDAVYRKLAQTNVVNTEAVATRKP